MFEVVELQTRRWRRSLAKVRCVEHVAVEKGGRTFEGYGTYSHQRYRLIIPVGATYTITVGSRELLEIGDRLSVDQLDAKGAFQAEWRLIASQ